MKDNDFDALDKYIEGLNKEDIHVPDILEEGIKKRISAVNQGETTYRPKKIYLRNIVAACIIFFAILGSAIWIPGVSTYAKYIPVIGGLLGYIKGTDAGTENAKKNGYNPIKLVTVSEDGYTFSINSMTIDEDRMVMQGTVIGDIFKQNSAQTPVNIDVSVKYMKPSFNFLGTSENSTYSFKLESNFADGELNEILKRDPDNLTLNVLIFKTITNTSNRKEAANSFYDVNNLPKYTNFDSNNDEVVKELKDIKIPISSINKSKVISVNKTVNLKISNASNVNLRLNNFQISPTRMHLNYNIPDKSILGFNFINPRIRDGKGNIYKEIQGTTLSPNELSVFFAPSTYFDSGIKNLYFSFDGISINNGTKINNFECKTEILLYTN